MKHNFDFEKGSETNPFGVPDGYFESFVSEAIPTSTPHKVSLWSKTRPYVYAAAMFAAVFSTGFFVFNTLSNSSSNTSAAQQTAEYNRMVNEIVADEVNEDLIIDYILADTN